MRNNPRLFKWKHFEAELILWAIRWYCQFPISYRDLKMMAEERGLRVSHTTPMRWVHEYGSELEKRIRKHLKKPNHSWRLDETYIKIKGKWYYLYRAVDSEANTLDWMLSAKRDKKAARRFLKKLLSNYPNPKVMHVDKNPSYPPAFAACQQEGDIQNTKLRQVKYLNNIQEQDHRFIKRRVRQSQWLRSFFTAKKTIADYEAMHMIRKGQVKCLSPGRMLDQKKFVENLFEIAA